MTSLQSNEDCQVNDPNNAYPTDAESLHLPLEGSMCVVFTGHYNGVGVEITSPNEITLLSHMGCFGKGSSSRSKPKKQNNSSPCIMRKRQFLKRNYWYKRFGKDERTIGSDNFFKDIDNLIAKIDHDTKNQVGREVIDLVSSDDEKSDSCYNLTEFDELGKNNTVVLVPNSDSEGDNYFANLKPKCCINKISLQEKLVLTLEEAFFLLYGLGCLKIVSNDQHIFNVEECWKAFSENNYQFIERYVVYHYFKSKGYIVKPGIKFGVLYRDGPGVNHADYIVVISFGHNSFNWVSILGHVRVATTTVKEIMIAEVIKPSKTNINLPQDLCEYKVRELVLTRKLPVKIDDSED